MTTTHAQKLLTHRSPFRRLRGGLAGDMLAEFFGTFVLLLLGDGSVAVAVVGLPGSGRQALHLTPFGPADWLIIVWGWAFAVAFGVYVAGGISGAHINPAVTLSFAVRRKFPWRKVVPYWFAQVTGALAGAAVVYAVYAPAINWYNATNHLSRPHSLNTFAIFATFPAQYFGSAWVGPFIDQVVGTGILVALIAALIDKRNQAPKGNIAALLIGLVVAVIGVSFGVNAGYAINPARDLGPRLFAYAFGWSHVAFPGAYQWFTDYWWIPIAGPLVGGVIGILLYDFFIGQVLGARGKQPSEPPSEPGRTPDSADQPQPADEPQPAGRQRQPNGQRQPVGDHRAAIHRAVIHRTE